MHTSVCIILLKHMLVLLQTCIYMYTRRILRKIAWIDYNNHYGTCSFLGLVYNVSKGKQLSWFSLFLMGLFVALIIVHVYRCTLYTCTVYFVSYFYTVDEWKSSVFSIEFQLFSNCSAYCSASATCWPYILELTLQCNFCRTVTYLKS